MTTIIETAVETVRDRSSDIVEALQEGIGTLGASAAERWAPETQQRSKSWLWLLLVALGVVIVLAVLRQRYSGDDNPDNPAGEPVLAR